MPSMRRGRVKNGVWRLLRALIHALLDALLPPPTLAQLKSARSRLTRHWREPPRKRDYQRTAL